MACAESMPIEELPSESKLLQALHGNASERMKLAARIGDRRAAAMLQWMGEAGTSALASRLNGETLGESHDDRSVGQGDSSRMEACLAIKSLLAQGKAGAAALGGVLAGEDAAARRNAAEALSQSEHGIPFLMQVLSDSRVDVKLCSLWALSRTLISPSEASAISKLLDDESAEVQEYAAQTLMIHGQVGADAIAQQLASGADSDGAWRLASEALCLQGRVGANAAAKMLGSQNHATARRRAAAVLESLGEEGAAALAVCLGDSCAGVRRRAAEALGHMGDAALPHAEHLAKLLEDKDTYVRTSATRALATLGLAENAPMRK
eukprot:TRINITY_DN24039_c0_g1_i2.p1 TRINITY_DN24039_c0_g1~~TRINITY_DN24039_c0_g1_i2.p1  ORF type:complete len:331 (-),score=94.37 TRINITY_DN24039_c0_g1_i2:73-1038(-)